jgi:hypothetical protein
MGRRASSRLVCDMSRSRPSIYGIFVYFHLHLHEHLHFVACDMYHSDTESMSHPVVVELFLLIDFCHIKSLL